MISVACTLTLPPPVKIALPKFKYSYLPLNAYDESIELIAKRTMQVRFSEMLDLVDALFEELHPILDHAEVRKTIFLIHLQRLVDSSYVDLILGPGCTWNRLTCAMTLALARGYYGPTIQDLLKHIIGLSPAALKAT